MTAREIVLRDKDTVSQAALYISFELGEKVWKLTMGDGRHNPSRCTVAAGDQAAVLQRIDKVKARWGLPASARVCSCYESGRDGWWLHRWLKAQGIENIVIDSASIEVNRRARRAKTDRLDGDKLLAMLMRYQAGETRVWSVVRAPSPQQEDERRTHRELARLAHARTAHTNRIGSLLVLHNLRPGRAGGRDWQRWWHSHAEQLPAALRAEIEQGRQQASTRPDDRIGMELAALPARKRVEPVVQPTLRLRRCAHAKGGHRGAGAALGDRAVALPRAWRTTAGHDTQDRPLTPRPSPWHMGRYLLLIRVTCPYRPWVTTP